MPILDCSNKGHNVRKYVVDPEGKFTIGDLEPQGAGQGGLARINLVPYTQRLDRQGALPAAYDRESEPKFWP